ncbi:hypothetical protein Back11_22770 [Paenibacillus baekrokdamisoli]|uniref:Uncharacterized protein n=1 Tax=Paenibacillus baekrokdamisoli TaxID=1712516 RepID=A0A3G9IRK5_9BACL|nr:phage holin family protein [Paenibacillus baekrokdamisoli]MBB3069715.1 asparagine N-glycosylation enzyme membrane subunit Stt3 [Paenibacillus baekrokdamisoli]BBH20932.1 hypothetical protein Back11_22770 [Paenibacillus baekrokdamisoli]
MEWSVITDLIDPSLFIVLAACWVVGYMLKQTPRIPDWIIIYVVTAFAIVVTLFLLGFHVKSVLQGILCGAVSVYSHQLIKQTKEGMGGGGKT